MTYDHRQLEESLPNYAAGRLDAADREELEAHLSECPTCRRLLAAIESVVLSIREGHPGHVGDHPSPVTVRGAARLESAPDTSVLRHIEGCESCGLEAGYWRAAGRAVPVDRRTVTVSSLAPALMAASLLVGLVGIALFLSSVPRPDRMAPRWSGPAQLLVLDSVRGAAAPSVALRDGQTMVPIAMNNLSLPGGATDPDQSLEIYGRDGLVRWRTVLSAEEIQAQRSRTGFVTVVVPADRLEPGNYVLRTSAGREFTFRIDGPSQK